MDDLKSFYGEIISKDAIGYHQGFFNQKVCIVPIKKQYTVETLVNFIGSDLILK